jgi:predicted DNA-binding transcriptional regulator AlpA
VTGAYRASDESGDWSTASTWREDILPAGSDAVTITAGTTVTVSADTRCSRLIVEPGATLVISAGATFTVADSVVNQGTMRQMRIVNNDSVSYLEIDDAAGYARYRGVEIDTPNDLGAVTVSVRALGDGEFCTSAGAASPAYARRCFEIEATNAATATVRLWALSEEMSGVSDPRIFRYVAPNWVQLPGPISNTVGIFTWVEAETPGFSHFLIAQDGGAPAVLRLRAPQAYSGWALVPAALGLLAGVVAVFVNRKLRRSRR